LFTSKFGIEIEFTGITRGKAAEVIAEYFSSSSVRRAYDSYDTQLIAAPDGRVWKIVSDASIESQRKQGRRTISAQTEYRV
jgi:ribosomal protein L16 Arg81 hydroxylase